MRRIQKVLWGFLLALAGVWWWVDQTAWASLSGVFEWRNVLSQLSGVLAIGVMSLAVWLAARPLRVERWLGGLDKMYRLHKWLGIAALTLSLSHWLIAKGPKWMVALGWLERRGRRPRPVFPEGSLQDLFSSQRGVAESLGEWALYGAVALMLLALIQRFPYHRFFRTHRLLALTYLLLVFHAVILTRFEYWETPLGVLLGGLMALGSVAAMLALFGRRWGRSLVVGHVQTVARDPAQAVLRLTVRLDGAWPGHRAGQFAFVRFGERSEAHPFTIASAWGADGQLAFQIKALGDFTRRLMDELAPGAPVTVEGPYGCFDFQSGTAEQLWISGGIGVTPFLARLQALVDERKGEGQGFGQSVVMVHSTAQYSADAESELRGLAERAGIQLQVLWAPRDGRLDAARLAALVPDWACRTLWFCGPAEFGRSLQGDLRRMGLSEHQFHQELFAMR